MNWTEIFDRSARAHLFRDDGYSDLLLAHIASHAQRLMVWQIEATSILIDDANADQTDTAMNLCRRINDRCGFGYPVDETADMIAQMVHDGTFPIRSMLTRWKPSDAVVAMLPLDREGTLRVGMAVIDGIARDIVRAVDFMGISISNEDAAPGARIDATAAYRRLLVDGLATLVNQMVLNHLGPERIMETARFAGYQAELEFSGKTMH